MVAVYKPPKKKPAEQLGLVKPVPDRYGGKLPEGRWTDAQGWAYSGPGDIILPHELYEKTKGRSDPKRPFPPQPGRNGTAPPKKPPPYVPSKAERLSQKWQTQFKAKYPGKKYPGDWINDPKGVPPKGFKGLEDIRQPGPKPPPGPPPVLPAKIKLGQPITPTTPISPKQKPSGRSGLFTTEEQRKGVKAPSSRRKPRTTSSAVTQEEGQTGTTTGIDYYPTLSKGGKVTAKKSKATTKKYAGGGYVKTYAKGSGSRKART